MIRRVQLVVGFAAIAAGTYLALRPLVVAGWLDKPHDTSTQMINLRASWGGALAGLGMFVAWLPAARPWWRLLVGLVMWAMAGVGAARLLGFALDGDPDIRQAIWIVAEAVLVVVGAVVLRRTARR